QTVQDWTETCNGSVKTAQTALRTWTAQGVGHSVSYSGRCSSKDEALVRDFIGDPSSARETILAEVLAFTEATQDRVLTLKSYAQARAKYDAEYIANKSIIFNVFAEERIKNITLPFLIAINETFDGLAGDVDTLVACISPREDDISFEGGDSCPGMISARELYDEIRSILDRQLEAARDGFEKYQTAFEDYVEGAQLSYANMEWFWITAMKVASRLRKEGSGLEGFTNWTLTPLENFEIPTVDVPHENGILVGLETTSSVDDIWESVQKAYNTSFATNFSIASARVQNLAEAWQLATEARLSNIKVAFNLDDYNPPTYNNAADYISSQEFLQAEQDEHEALAEAYKIRSRALLDSLGPAAANISFPSTNSLETNFSMNYKSSNFFSSVEYSFVDFSSSSIYYGEWLVSFSLLGALLMAADFLFRSVSSLRLIVQFWSRAGLCMPDADMRIDRVSSATGDLLTDMKSAVLIVLTHPASTFFLASAVTAMLCYNLASVYVPLFRDYQAGCVEHTKTGTFFTQNLYSIAYNYAADEGNRDMWTF
ncbi:unnamed protein product, partial [Choristocarpus tenellus]